MKRKNTNPVLTINKEEAKDLINILQLKLQNGGLKNKKYLVEIIERSTPNTFLLLENGYIKGISFGYLTKAFIKSISKGEKEAIMSIFYFTEKKGKTINFYNNDPKIKQDEWYFLKEPIKIELSFSENNFFLKYEKFKEEVEKR